MAPSAKKSEPKKAMKAKKDINLVKEGPLRGKASRIDFLTDVATQSTLSLADVKKCLDGLRITVSRNLRENQKCRIPNLVSLKLKIYPARAATKQMIFGKEKLVKARPKDVQKIIASPMKELKDSVE